MLRVSRSDIWAGYGMSKGIPVERNVAGGERQVAPEHKAKLKGKRTGFWGTVEAGLGTISEAL